MNYLFMAMDKFKLSGLKGKNSSVHFCMYLSMKYIFLLTFFSHIYDSRQNISSSKTKERKLSTDISSFHWKFILTFMWSVNVAMKGSVKLNIESQTSASAFGLSSLCSLNVAECTVSVSMWVPANKKNFFSHYHITSCMQPFFSAQDCKVVALWTWKCIMGMSWAMDLIFLEFFLNENRT